MKTIKHIIIFSLIMLTVWACEKEVTDVNPPEVDPMLVVYSFISPMDSDIYVEVTKSIPYFGEGSNNAYNNRVTDAIVVMTSGNNTIQLFPDSFGQFYTASTKNFPILPGNKYELKVSAPGGFYCSAQTIVPVAGPNSLKVSLDSVITQGSQGETTIRYKVSSNWTDVAGVTNYYRITSSISVTIEFGTEDGLCNLLFTDINNDGKNMTRTCDFEIGYFGFEPVFGSYDKVYLLTLDYAYYRYHLSLSNYNGDGDPFSEPTQIYTNVEGGLGCFGSYLQLAEPLR